LKLNPKLCAAGVQLRDQVDTWFPDRCTKSPEGWLGDSRHSARKSDHNPDRFGWVRGLDLNSRLESSDSLAPYLADQIRVAAKSDPRISYVIFNGRICSKILNWKWRKYKGINPHKKHIHISFTTLGDLNGTAFDIPLIGGKI
jgi:hypothetical protein